MYNNGNSATGNRAVSKLLVVLLSVAICAAFMPLLSDSADAAAKKPGKVKKVTLTVDKNTNKVSVKWKKAKGAKKYEVKVTEGKTKLVASKKLKKKSFSFNGQANTKYTVRVRGIKGKKVGKWSAKKSVTTGKSQGQKNSEKAIADAKAALEQAQKDLKDAQDALEQAKKDKETDQQTIKDLEQKVKDAEAAEAAAKAEAERVAEEAQAASDIAKGLEGHPTDDEIMAIKEAYDELSDDAKALIPANLIAKMNERVLEIEKRRANGFVVEIRDLSPAAILEGCDWWDQEDHDEYAERVNDAIETFDGLSLNQQMLVGFEARNRLVACQFALEKAQAIIELNGPRFDGYMEYNYFDEEQEAIIKILDGEEGAIAKIKKAETSEEIAAIKGEAGDAIEKVATKVEVVTAMIDKLSPDYDVITKNNVRDAVKAVEDINVKYEELSWSQKKEIKNFDQLSSVDHRIDAYYIGSNKNEAKEALEAGVKKINYFDAEWDEVNAAITEGKAAIDAAATDEEVVDAVAKALDKRDAVPTKVKVVRAMIEECVENYLDNLTDENIETARKDVAAVTAKYDKMLTPEQQAAIYADEDGLEEDVDDLLYQIDNYELNKAKDAAKAELEGYKAYEDEYFADEWIAVEAAISDGEDDIDDVILPEEPTKEDIEEAIKAVDDALLAAAKAIDGIQTKSEVVTEDIADLYDYYLNNNVDVIVIEWAADLRAIFNDLTDEQQAEVENIDLLEKVENAIEKEKGSKATALENQIAGINELEDLVKGRNIVFDAEDAYDAADDAVKALVDEDAVAVLDNAMATIAEDWPQEITAKITALYQAKDKYDDMTAEEQEKFKAELTKVEEELAEYDAVKAKYHGKNRVVREYREELEKVRKEVKNSDQEEAEYIIGLITSMPPVDEITQENAEDVAEIAEEAREAYDAANSDVQDMVDEDGYTEYLEAVEDKLDALDIEAAIADLAYVQDLTLEDGEEAIEEAAEDVADARSTLDEASDDVKALVSDEAKDALVAAENKIDALGVEELIDEIPLIEDLTLDEDDVKAVTDAREAYEAYKNEYAQDKVDDDAVEALENAENKIAALKIEAMGDELNDPEDVSIADQEDIEAAISAYINADKAVKGYVSEDTYNRLRDCGAALINAMTEDLMFVDSTDPVAVEAARDLIEDAVAEYKWMKKPVRTAFEEGYPAAFNQLKALKKALDKLDE